MSQDNFAAIWAVPEPRRRLPFGVAAFTWPGLTLMALALLFGAYALIDGARSAAAARVGSPRGLPWCALLAEGQLGILMGVLTLLWPGLTALVLLYLIVAWALATGVLEIVAAFRLRREIKGEWLLVLGGVLSALFGLTLALWSGGALALVWLIGAYAVLFGILPLVLAFRLREWVERFESPGA